jgi:hypothetical protein
MGHLVCEQQRRMDAEKNRVCDEVFDSEGYDAARIDEPGYQQACRERYHAERVDEPGYHQACEELSLAQKRQSRCQADIVSAQPRYFRGEVSAMRWRFLQGLLKIATDDMLQKLKKTHDLSPRQLAGTIELRALDDVILARRAERATRMGDLVLAEESILSDNPILPPVSRRTQRRRDAKNARTNAKHSPVVEQEAQIAGGVDEVRKASGNPQIVGGCINEVRKASENPQIVGVQSECIICLEFIQDADLYCVNACCGHVLYCTGCANDVVDTPSARCPVCYIATPPGLHCIPVHLAAQWGITPMRYGVL